MSAVLDDQGVVVADLLCRKCGYNLRGLRDCGRCPECGAPARVSLDTSLLRFAPAKWIRRLALGSLLSAVGFAIILLTPLVAVMLMYGVSRSTEMFVGLSILGVGLALDLIGSLQLSRRPPAIWSSSGSDLRGRRAIQICLMVFCPLLGIHVALAVLDLKEPLFFTLIACVMCFALWHILELGYCRRMMLQIPDARLAASARFAQVVVLSALGAVFPIGFCIGVLSALGGPSMTATTLIWLVDLLLLSYVAAMVRIALRLGTEARVAAKMESVQAM